MEASSRETNNSNTQQLIRFVVKRMLFLVLILWACAAIFAFETRDNYAGKLPADYTPNQYLVKAGVDLRHELPLRFANQNDNTPGVVLLGVQNGMVVLNLQTGSYGYIMRVPQDSVDFQTGPQDAIRVKMGDFSLISNAVAVLFGETPKVDTSHASYRLVPNEGKYHIWDALLLHDSPPTHRIVRVPLTSTPTWREIQHSGLGAFLREQQSSVESVFITMTENSLDEHKDLVLK